MALFSLAAVWLIWVVGCSQNEKSTPESTAPSVHAEVITAQRVDIPVQIEVTGLVVAKTEATLSSKIRGIVQEVKVGEGDVVRQGQRLVVLESRDLQAALAHADAELENAQITLARMERLFNEDSVAKQELDNARRVFKGAQATKQGALAQLSYTVIKAPFAGQITDRMIEPGEFASPGHFLLKLEDPHHLRLEVMVPEKDLQAFTQGKSLPIIIDALQQDGVPPPVTGTIAQIVPTGDSSTHTFLVKIDLSSVPALKSGMFGRAVYTKGRAQTTVVPVSSLLIRNGLTGVFVVQPDQVIRLRWVKAGRSVDAGLSFSAMEILSGLNPGELILVNSEQGVDGARLINERSIGNTR